MDEDDNKPVEMQIDEEAYPLYIITNFESHLELKPPRKEQRQKT